MDRNEFFREAALRICGNLEIEEAMQTLIQFLGSSMPVTKIFLQHYDQDFQAMRTIAYADENECRKLDLLTPLSKSASDMAGNAPPETDAFLLDDPSTFPVSREMTEFHCLVLHRPGAFRLIFPAVQNSDFQTSAALQD